MGGISKIGKMFSPAWMAMDALKGKSGSGMAALSPLAMAGKALNPDDKKPATPEAAVTAALPPAAKKPKASATRRKTSPMVGGNAGTFIDGGGYG